MKFSSGYVKRSETKAFTLIELLVAVGVTALMVTLMLTIVVNVLGGWNRSSGSLTAGSQARLVLDQISRDLQFAIMQRDGNGWLVASIQQNQTGTGSAGVVGSNWSPTSSKPSGTGVDPASLTPSFVIPFPVAPSTVPVIEHYRFGQGGMWLRFFTTGPDTNSTGDLHRISAPRAVAYQIVRLPVVAGSTGEERYQLFRSEVRPGHSDPTLAARSTIEVGYNLLDSTNLYNTPSATNSGVLISNGVDQGGEPGSIRQPDRNQVIANNVIDFGVRFWSRTGANLTIAFPRTTTDLNFAATNDITAATAAGIPNVAFPEVAEVFIRILTEEGALLIANLEGGLTPSTPEKWWEIALANSRVYTSRVELMTPSL